MTESLDKRVDFGELIWHDEDTFVARGVLDGRAVVIKRFRRPEYRREIETYQLLGSLGVPTLELVGHGEDWLAVEDTVDGSRWRPATADDLHDPTVARHLADWYARLHLAGAEVLQVPDYDENVLVTDDALADVAARWPDLADGITVARRFLPGWQETAHGLPRTLTCNDFAVENVAVARDGSAAIMTGYDLLGRGYRYADVRDALAGLGPGAEAFWADYVALAAPIPDDEIAADQRLAPLRALVFAVKREQPALPAWAQASADYVRSLA